MDIINPFEELVVFGKKLPLEPQSSTVIAALRPTGRHLGHGGDLTHVRGKASGGKQPQIERYTTSPKGLHEGPFKGSVKQPRTRLLAVRGSGKGFRTGPFGKALPPGQAAGVKRSLGIINATPKGVLKPTGAKMKGLQQAMNNAPPKSLLAKGGADIAPVRKRNSNIPSGARQGSRL